MSLLAGREVTRKPTEPSSVEGLNVPASPSLLLCVFVTEARVGEAAGGGKGLCAGPPGLEGPALGPRFLLRRSVGLDSSQREGWLAGWLVKPVSPCRNRLGELPGGQSGCSARQRLLCQATWHLLCGLSGAPQEDCLCGGGHFLPVPHSLQHRGLSSAFPLKFALSKMSPLAKGG